MSDLLKMGFTLGLLVLLLILVNIFVIVPGMTEEPVQFTATIDDHPQRFETGDVAPGDTIIDRKGRAAGQTFFDISPREKNGRNPFYRPGERQEPVVVKEVTIPEKVVVQAEEEEPQLSMVIVGVQSRKALLDETFVSEGDMFYGYRVKSIGSDQVILADKFGELSIRLGASKKSGEILPEPAGLIER